MAATDGAKPAKPPAPPPSLRHKRLGGAHVAKVVSLAELLRFVHRRGEAGVAVEWVASRQLALTIVEQSHVAGVGRSGCVGVVRIGLFIRCIGTFMSSIAAPGTK